MVVADLAQRGGYRVVPGCAHGELLELDADVGVVLGERLAAHFDRAVRAPASRPVRQLVRRRSTVNAVTSPARWCTSLARSAWLR